MRARRPLTRGSPDAVSIPSRTSRKLGSLPTSSRSRRSSCAPSASPRLKSTLKMMLPASGVTFGFNPLISNTPPKASNMVRNPTAAKKPTRKRRMPSDVSGQRALTYQAVGERACPHRLTDRHRANADARVVRAVGRDLDLVALNVDGPHRVKDRACRLDRKPGDDVLAGRDSAEDAAGIVRQKGNP